MSTPPTWTAVTPYKTSTLGAGTRVGVPITEYDTINYGLAAERTNVETFANSPQQYIDFVNKFGDNQHRFDRYRRLVARRPRQRDLHHPRPVAAA